MENILSNLIDALKLGELMMVEELTLQATCAYVLAFAFVSAIVLWLFAKALTARKQRKGLEGRTEMSIQVLKGVAVLVASAAFFVTGYQYAAALYKKDIEEMRREYAEQSRVMEEKYRATEQKQTQALVAAWQERDAALARADRLSGDVERVRKQAADAKRRLSAAGTDSRKSERQQLARSAELVERGSVLLDRCVRLAERTSIDKDALAKIVSQ